MDYGYLCFAYTKGVWYDWVIARITGSQWSHSFFTSPPILGKEMAMEATQHGVSLTMFDVSYRGNPTQRYEVYRFSLGYSTIDSSIANRMKELETSYGYLEYLWFVWRYLNRFLGRDIKAHDNWCQNGTKVCSQLVREYMEDCGFKDLFNGLGRGSASAQDIYDIVKANPQLFELIESQL